jgi:hypothetical protein
MTNIVADEAALKAVEAPLDGTMKQMLDKLPRVEMYVFNKDATTGIAADDGTTGFWNAIGSNDLEIETIDANATASTGKLYLCDASANTINVTLPDATTCKDETVAVKVVDLDNAVTVTPNGTQTIDSGSEFAFTKNKDSVVVKSDGSNWAIVDSHLSVDKVATESVTTDTSAKINKVYIVDAANDVTITMPDASLPENKDGQVTVRVNSLATDKKVYIDAFASGQDIGNAGDSMELFISDISYTFGNIDGKWKLLSDYSSLVATSYKITAVNADGTAMKVNGEDEYIVDSVQNYFTVKVDLPSNTYIKKVTTATTGGSVQLKDHRMGEVLIYKGITGGTLELTVETETLYYEKKSDLFDDGTDALYMPLDGDIMDVTERYSGHWFTSDDKGPINFAPFGANLGKKSLHCNSNLHTRISANSLSHVNLANKSFIVSAWIRVEKVKNSNYFLGNQDSGTNQKSLHIGFRNDSKFTLAFYTADVDWDYNQNDAVGDMVHVCLFHDTNSLKSELFINGVSYGEKTHSKAYLSDLSLIGGATNSARFDGWISELRVFTDITYDTTENAAKVARLFDDGNNKVAVAKAADLELLESVEVKVKDDTGTDIPFLDGTMSAKCYKGVGAYILALEVPAGKVLDSVTDDQGDITKIKHYSDGTIIVQVDKDAAFTNLNITAKLANQVDRMMMVYKSQSSTPNQSAPHASTVTVKVFDNKIADTQNIYDTAAGLATITEPGLYELKYTLYFDSDADKIAYAWMTVFDGSGAEKIVDLGYDRKTNAIDQNLTLHGSTIVKLEAGDKVGVRFKHWAGGNKNIIADPNSNSFSIMRVDQYATIDDAHVLATTAAVTINGGADTIRGKADWRVYEAVGAYTLQLDLPLGKMIDTVAPSDLVKITDALNGKIQVQLPEGNGDQDITVVWKDKPSFGSGFYITDDSGDLTTTYKVIKKWDPIPKQIGTTLEVSYRIPYRSDEGSNWGGAMTRVAYSVDDGTSWTDVVDTGFDAVMATDSKQISSETGVVLLNQPDILAASSVLIRYMSRKYNGGTAVYNKDHGWGGLANNQGKMSIIWKEIGEAWSLNADAKLATPVTVTINGGSDTISGKADWKIFEGIGAYSLNVDVPAGKEIDTVAPADKVVVEEPVTGKILVQQSIGDGDLDVTVTWKDGGVDTWHEVGAAGEPAFQNGYHNKDSSFPVRFRKLNGVVYIQGAVEANGDNKTVFTLPVGYRPGQLGKWACSNSTTSDQTLVYTNSNGNVTIRSQGGGYGAWFDTVHFIAEN